MSVSWILLASFYFWAFLRCDGQLVRMNVVTLAPKAKAGSSAKRAESRHPRSPPAKPSPPTLPVVALTSTPPSAPPPPAARTAPPAASSLPAARTPLPAHAHTAAKAGAQAIISAACNTRALFAAARARVPLLRTPRAPLTRPPSSEYALAYDVAQEGTAEVDAQAARCDPLAFTAATAAAALDGEHVLMAGDSLTRYSFLSLAYFLETGGWLSPWPPNTREGSWKGPGWVGGDWPTFFYNTTQRLGGGRRAMCDCSRGHGWAPETWRENRFFLSPNARVRMSYLSWFAGLENGARNLTLLNEPCLERAFRAALSNGVSGDVSCPQRSCTPGDCAPLGLAAGEYVAPHPQLLPALVAALRPTVLVLNSGLWPSQPAASAVAAAIREAVAAVAPSQLRVLWRTTTCIKGEPTCPRPLDIKFVDTLLRETNGLVELLDIGALTANAAETALGYAWDTMHFTEVVYSLFNAAMLACLGGGDCA